VRLVLVRAIYQAIPIVAILLIAAGHHIAARPESAYTVQQDANFYAQEEWEEGKLRRWMRNNGEVRIRISGSPAHVNIRFYAESFRIPRTLEVQSGGRSLAQVTIPTEPLYVIVRDLPVSREEVRLRFVASPGPEVVDEHLRNGDRREVSIAFGPISIIDAASPQAAREQPGAFPNVWHIAPGLSKLENLASNLRREGRLTEAWDAYEAALSTGRVHPSTYIWAGLTRLALDDLPGARLLLNRGRQQWGFSPTMVFARRASARLYDYLNRSEMIAGREADPARRHRQRGEIHRAVAIYRDILGRRPGDLTASYWLGLLTSLAERPKEAAPLLETIARARPDSADAALIRELLRYVGR
jgi:tetratricopeptide (TPR) repeat protein